MDRANASASSDDIYFASQHSVHNLCETVAQKDFSFLQSHEVVGLLSATEPEAFSEWRAFQESWNRLDQDRFMKDGYAATPPTAPAQAARRLVVMETAIVNDERVMHGVTPIIQLDPNLPAYRDVLVVTFSKR